MSDGQFDCSPCRVLLHNAAADFITEGRRKKSNPAMLRNAVSDYPSRFALTEQILGILRSVVN